MMLLLIRKGGGSARLSTGYRVTEDGNDCAVSPEQQFRTIEVSIVIEQFWYFHILVTLT
jgi:uncharacterized protein YneR